MSDQKSTNGNGDERPAQLSAPPQSRTSGRKVGQKRRLAATIVVLLIVAWVANILADNPWTHRLIRTLINQQVREHTNVDLDFKAIKATLVPPGIEVYGVRVSSALPPRAEIATAARAEAHLSIWSLLTGSPRIGELVLSDLDVIWPPPAGFPGFARKTVTAAATPEKATSWPPDFAVPLEFVKLRNARFWFEERLRADIVPISPDVLTISGEAINLELEIDDWDDMQLRFDAGAINSTRGPAWLIEEANIRASASLSGRQLTATSLSVNAERLKLEGSLVATMNQLVPATGIDSIDLRADAKVDGDFSMLGSILDIPDTSGRTQATASVTAQLPVASDNPATFGVNVEGQVDGARLGGIKLHNSRAKLHIDADRIDFKDIEIVVGDEVYGRGMGELKLNSEIDFDFTTTTKNLRLMDLLSTFDVDFDVCDAGLTSPAVRVRGKGDPFVMQVDATVALEDVQLPSVTMDQTKFKRSPTCLLDLRLAITSRALDPGGSGGQCFTAAGANTEVRSGNTEAPGDASAVSRVDVGGIVHFNAERGLDLAINLPRLDAGLGNWFAQVPLAGLGSANVRIHGPYDRVLIDVNAKLDQASVLAIPLGLIESKLRVEKKDVTWTGLQIVTPEGATISSSSGTLKVGDDLMIDSRLTLGGLSDEWVAAAVRRVAPDVPLAFGIPAAEFDIKGPLLRPLAWTGNMKIEATVARYGEESLFDRATATVNIDGEGWKIEPARVVAGDLAVDVSLRHKRNASPVAVRGGSQATIWQRLGWHPSDDLLLNIHAGRAGGKKADTSQATIDHLGRLPWAGSVLSKAGIRGKITAKGAFRGNLDKLGGSFEGSIEDPTLLSSPMANFAFRAFMDGLKTNVTVSHSGNVLEGRFSADFGQKSLPYEWYVNLRRFDARAVATEFFHSDPRNYAYVSADWTMRGNLTDWWRSTGELSLTDAQIRYVRDVAGQVKTLQISNDQPVTMDFTEDGWQFRDGKELFLTGRNLHVKMSVPRSRPPENLDFRLDGILDMGLFREFATQVESATGKLKLSGAITGSVSEPKASFEITDLKANPFIATSWEPVSLGLADFRPPLRNIRLTANIGNEGLTIDSFSANKGIGTVSARGRLNFFESETAGEEGSRLDVVLKDASIVYPVAFLKSFDSTVSGAVSISGRGQPWRLSGDITVNKARSTREVDIRDEIINAARSQQVIASATRDKPVLLLDVNVNADRSINIANRNIQAIVSTSLQITGTDVAPVVAGQVEIERGKFVYKRDFTITRGLVIFDDPVRPDPGLDILAVSEVQNYRVYFAISGKLSAPVVDFSIDPPTRQNGAPITKVDILVLLSRGSLPDESRAVGETQNAAAAEALNLLVGQFEEPVEKLFDLSGQNVIRQVFIDTYPSPEGNPIPRFNMPLNLSDELDVVLRVDQANLQVTSEYTIHDSISLSVGFERQNQEPNSTSRTAQNAVPADTGADLKFRFAFP